MIFSVSSYAGNLLINSGFESGNTVAWKVPNAYHGTGVVGTGNPNSGNFAFEITGNPDRYPSLWQELAVTAGNTYRFKGSLKVAGSTNSSSSTKGKHYMIQPLWYRADGTKISNFWVGGRNVNTDGYVQLSRDIVAPDEAVMMKLKLQANKADGQGYFDDLSVMDITADNLLANSGFETGERSDWKNLYNGTIDSMNSRTGDYAFQVPGDTSHWPAVTQEITVIGGNTYEFSGWIKVVNRTTGGYMAQPRWYDDDGVEIKINGKRTWIGGKYFNTDYSKFNKEVVAPVDAATAKLYLQANKADGVGYFDDLSMIDITPVSEALYTVDFNAAPGAYVTTQFTDDRDSGKAAPGFFFREFPTLNDNGDVGGATYGEVYTHDGGYPVQPIHGALWRTDETGDRVLSDLGIAREIDPITGSCGTDWSECGAFVLGLTNELVAAGSGNMDTYNHRAIGWYPNSGWGQNPVYANWITSDFSAATDVNQDRVFVGMARATDPNDFRGYVPRAFVNQSLAPIENTPSYAFAISERFNSKFGADKLYVVGSASFNGFNGTSYSRNRAFLQTLNYDYNGGLTEGLEDLMGMIPHSAPGLSLDGMSEAYDVVAKQDYRMGLPQYFPGQIRPLVVGVATAVDNEIHAFLYTETHRLGMQDLGVLDGGSMSVARSINQTGQIVGYATNAEGEPRAVLFTYNQAIIRQTNPIRVNESGEWEYWVEDIMLNAKVVDLNTLVELPEGWVLVDAYKVNNRSQILARAEGPNNENIYVILNALDSDSDGVGDNFDNCTLVSNPEQRDSDSDGYGNICDPDINNDGFVDEVDRKLFDDLRNSQNSVSPHADFDGDTYVWDSDLRIFESKYLQRPGPSYIFPETDGDSDGIIANLDNCPTIPNTDQADADNDGVGNPCDYDVNNDGTVDDSDLWALYDIFSTSFLTGDYNQDNVVDWDDWDILWDIINSNP